MINLMAMHTQRFFSYLSAFAGFMLVLVNGGNYFVMFIGWTYSALYNIFYIELLLYAGKVFIYNDTYQ